MNRLVRRGRRFFGVPRSPGQPVFAVQGQRFTAAQTVIRCFYAFLLYLAIAQFGDFAGFIARAPFSPLWPVLWLPRTHPAGAIKVLLAFYTGSSLLAAVWPAPRWTRGLAALGLLEFVALKYSFGKIGHSLHLLVLVSLVLIFLPRGWETAARVASRCLRQSTLLVFWTCQAAILLSYTMSGLGKFGGALYQMALGQPNAFLPSALGALIAQRLLQTNSTSALGGWIILHPWLTWPLLPLPIYLELFSFWIAFRPSLQKLWTAILVVFHLGTFFMLTISFPQSCFLLAIFFFHSPWQFGRPGLGKMFLDLPFFGDLVRMGLDAKAAPAGAKRPLKSNLSGGQSETERS